MAKKIFMLGLDGLSPYYLVYVVNKLQLHNIQQIINKSYFRTLLSIPPTTFIGWTSLITGVNPAKHGIWGFTHFYIKSGKINTSIFSSYDVKSPRLFEITAFHGLKSIVVNYPLTYPIEGIYIKNNVIVSDTLASPRIDCFPKKIKKLCSSFIKKINKNITNVLEKTYYLIRLFEYLCNNFDWNLALLVLDVPDKIFHIKPSYLWKLNNNKFNRIMRDIDNLVGHLSQNADITLIVSDHGLAWYKKWVNPLAYLYKAGIIPCNYTISYNILRKIIKIIYGNTFLSNMHLVISYLMQLHSRLHKRSRLRFVSDINYYLLDEVDAENTWIILFRTSHLRDICYNYLSKISRNFHFEVYKLEEIFRGKYYPLFPALFVVPKYEKGIYLSLSYAQLFTEINSYFYKPAGRHHPYGTFLAYGREIEKSLRVDKIVSIYDILPTILALFNLPIPQNINGKIIPLNSNLIKASTSSKADYNIILKIKKLRRKLY